MKNKKVFISLLIIYVAIIIAFNVLFFVIPINKDYSNSTIWISFVCSNLSIVISLIISSIVLNKVNIKVNVFGYPLIKESLIFMLLCILYSIFIFSFGSAFEIKAWITILVETVLYCGFIILITLSLFNKKHIESKGYDTKLQSSFKTELLTRLKDIANKNESPELDDKLDELIDLVTYIDPISIREAEICEDQVLNMVNELECTLEKGILHSEIDLIDRIIEQIQNRKNIIISNRK